MPNTSTDIGVDEIRDLIFDCVADLPDGYTAIGIDDDPKMPKIALLHIGTGEVWLLTVQAAKFEVKT